jgi:hypothetical protein
MPGTLLYYVPDYQSPAADHVAAPLYALAATAEVRVAKGIPPTLSIFDRHRSERNINPSVVMPFFDRWAWTPGAA